MKGIPEFLNSWLGVWGMFQGYVGKFLDCAFIFVLKLKQQTSFPKTIEMPQHTDQEIAHTGPK